MVRLIIFFAVLFAFALGGAWLADRPGTVVLDWQGYQVQTSLMVGLVGLLVLVIVLFIAWTIIVKLVRSPRSFARFWGRRRRERGYRALTNGLIAVGSGDVSGARKYAKDAQKLLRREPATKLLAAQAAQLGGDSGKAQGQFTSMLEHESTQVLGLHGLYLEAQRAGETVAARHYAKEALAISPALPWAGKAMLDFQASEGDWEAALTTLERNAQFKLIDKKTARRERAVLLTARALELETGSPDRARALAKEAHGLAPDLVPAAAVAGRLYSRSGDFGRAAKILEAVWKKNPHPDIAEAYIHVRPGDSIRDRLKRVNHLNQLRANHPEGAMALARVAIDANDWEAAREALTKLLRSAPTKRACLMMAEVEEGQHGDHGRVREWLSRAVRAPQDPAWVADGVVSDTWAPISPVTGELDAFEWKTPPTALAPPEDGPLIDEALLQPRPPVAPKAVIEPAKDVTPKKPEGDKAPVANLEEAAGTPGKSDAGAVKPAAFDVPASSNTDGASSGTGTGDTPAPAAKTKEPASNEQAAATPGKDPAEPEAVTDKKGAEAKASAPDQARDGPAKDAAPEKAPERTETAAVATPLKPEPATSEPAKPADTGGRETVVPPIPDALADGYRTRRSTVAHPLGRAPDDPGPRGNGADGNGLKSYT